MNFTVIDTKSKGWSYDFNFSETGEFKGDFGYVYVLEVGDRVKIGSTCDLKNRYSVITGWFKRYAGIDCGRFAVSDRHSSFKITEHKVHKFMNQYRVSGSEMFDVNFSDALKILESFEYDTKELDEVRRVIVYERGKKMEALCNCLFNKIEKPEKEELGFDKLALDLYNELDKYFEFKFRIDTGLDIECPSPEKLFEAFESDDFSYYGTKFQKKEVIVADVSLLLSELCKTGGNIQVEIKHDRATYNFNLLRK